MKKTKIFNKKAIIVIPIVLALLLGSVGTLGLVGGFYQDDKNSTQEEYLSTDELEQLYREQMEELKNSIDDKTVLKIIDIHENLNEHLDKSQTLELNFFEFEDGYSVGIEYFFEGGDSLLFDIPADLGKVELPDNIQNNDWVKVTGKIGKIDEVDNDHTHTIPVIHISSIEKIDK